MRTLRTIIIIGALCVLQPLLVNGQGDPLVEAYKAYRAGELAGARTLVEKAVTTREHADDPEAWLLRGFILKDQFKVLPPGPEADVLRTLAFESLTTCLALDKAGTYRTNALQAHEFLARSHYNDAARALSEMRAEDADGHFAAYRAAMLQVDPKADLRSREIEFLNALGTVHTKRYNRERDVLAHFDRAVKAFHAVLVLDPLNYGANYNLATLHYNRGVYNIQRITAEFDIPSIQQMQEVSREHFREALPFMLNAHEMRPDRRETLLGLEGIYYSLQDQPNADRFRQLFEELPAQDN
jgi:tetratricopeptide (TPR) repeat protein